MGRCSCWVVLMARVTRQDQPKEYVVSYDGQSCVYVCVCVYDSIVI